MRIAYLECFSGISGDMFMGALIDAGVPREVFVRTVEVLGLDARLEIKRVDRSGISATKVDVIAAGEKELPREEFWAKEQAEHHDHAHAHSHSHSHEGGPTTLMRGAAIPTSTVIVNRIRMSTNMKGSTATPIAG